jgi:hypothetical protein
MEHAAQGELWSRVFPLDSRHQSASTCWRQTVHVASHYGIRSGRGLRSTPVRIHLKELLVRFPVTFSNISWFLLNILRIPAFWTSASRVPQGAAVAAFCSVNEILFAFPALRNSRFRQVCHAKFQCRRGSFPGLATLIRDHIRNIRLAADGLELACSQSRDPHGDNKQSSQGMRMTYTPEKEKK